MRFVVFLQGCPMRCQYCHNPDTWDIKKGILMSSDELIERFNKNRAFYKNGGITVTGGEPLLQIDFLIEFFQMAKKQKIHTCIDTSGITYNKNRTEKLDELLKITDLVLLDIKHIDSREHKALTTFDNKAVIEFAKYLDAKKIPIWIRHVIVPGITDKKEYLTRLGEFIGTLSNVRAVDVLPYHTMGVGKYKELGIQYSLEGVRSATKKEASDARKTILKTIHK